MTLEPSPSLAIQLRSLRPGNARHSNPVGTVRTASSRNRQTPEGPGAHVIYRTCPGLVYTRRPNIMPAVAAIAMRHAASDYRLPLVRLSYGREIGCCENGSPILDLRELRHIDDDKHRPTLLTLTGTYTPAGRNCRDATPSPKRNKNDNHRYSPRHDQRRLCPLPTVRSH